MEEKPNCPKCNNPMGKAGKPLSGTKVTQRWRCSKCGITTTKPENPICSNHHMNYVRVPMDDLHYAQLKLRALKTSTTIEEFLFNIAFREH